jgi:hypothetical protein
VLALSALYAILAFLFPIGIYCLVLAVINRRPTPLLVSGFWDTVGLLFAGSGFFLVTIPLLLNIFYLRSLETLVGETFDSIWLRHWLIWLVYYLLLVSGSIFLFSWRMNKTMIYNIEPEVLRPALEAALGTLGLGMRLQEQRLIIAPEAGSGETSVMEGLPAPAPTVTVPQRQAALHIESFPAMSHVTLHWEQATAETRREIEKALWPQLELAAPQENTAAGWFLSVSGMILGMSVMLLLTLLFLEYATR